MAQQDILTASGLRKEYGKFVAANVPQLAVREGEFFTIVGPSGSGKSTLLNMLTGTSPPSSGHIKIRGQDVTHLPPEKRPTSMVFQNLALFPHMSVGENIGFALEVRKVGKEQRRHRVMALMEQLRLPNDYYDKAITQCSGGERQRVAIARALANDSEIVFFDEPLSAIDYRLRKTLEVELMDVHRATGKTFVYVTHSLEEAMTMSDRLTIMREGKVVQTGTAREIYNAPANEFVAQFLGEVNLFEVSVTKQSGAEIQLDCPNLSTSFSALSERQIPLSTKLKLVVRPENLKLIDLQDRFDNSIEATIQHRLVLGSRIQYEAIAAGQRILIEQLSKVDLAGKEMDIQPGQTVQVGWNRSGGILVHE
jgi:spermidine/putrescine transport system ATP-binding protein